MGQLFVNIGLRTSNNYKFDTKRIREMYAEYFVGEGAIPWQGRKIGRNFYDETAE